MVRVVDKTGVPATSPICLIPTEYNESNCTGNCNP